MRARRPSASDLATWTLRRLPVRLTSAALAALLLACAFATPAWAAGSSKLDRYILSDPEPGWARTPESTLNHSLERSLGSLPALTGLKTTGAAEGWASPDRSDGLVILLVRSPRTIANPVTAARSAAVAECLAASGSMPLSVAPIPSIADSANATCTASGLHVQIMTMWWVQNNVFVNVFFAFTSSSTPEISTVRLDAIARQQAAAVPASGIDAPGGLERPLLIALGFGIVVLLVVVAIVVTRRQVRRQVGLSPGTAGPYPAPSGVPWLAPGVGGPGMPGTGYGAPPFPYATPPVPTAGPRPGGQPPASSSAAAVSTPAASALPTFEAVMSQLSTGHQPTAREVTAEPADGQPADGQPAPVPTEGEGGRTAGWYPDGGDPHHQSYWDGTQWTKKVSWDGSAWVVQK